MGGKVSFLGNLGNEKFESANVSSFNKCLETTGIDLVFLASSLAAIYSSLFFLIPLRL